MIGWKDDWLKKRFQGVSDWPMACTDQRAWDILTDREYHPLLQSCGEGYVYC